MEAMRMVVKAIVWFREPRAGFARRRFDRWVAYARKNSAYQ